MHCTRALALAGVAVVMLAAGAVGAQSSTAPGIDVEVYNPINGSNSVCVAPATSFWVNVLVRPGAGTTSCAKACVPSPVPGGSANIATGAIDVLFDPTRLGFVSAETNTGPGTAAIDGLIQTQDIAQGRLGWALAGDWTPNADPTGTMASPCAMGLLTTSGWVLRAHLSGASQGLTTVRLRRHTDSEPFELSFADVCGSPAFTESSGDINEVVPTVVLVDAACAAPSGVIFFDNLERGSAVAWSAVNP